MLEKINMMKQRTQNTLKAYRFFGKPILLFSAIYLIALSALLRANFYYIDDLGRAAFGYVQWEVYARYLSVFFSHIIHADSYLTDVSPLPQMIAVLVMAIASTMTIYIIGGGKKEYSLWMIAAALPLGLNPYFLECFSYKYDSPYMAMSVLASVFPLIFWKSKTWKFILASIVGTLCMCMTYQVSAGIYPMLVVIVCIRMWVENEDIKDILRMALISAASFLAGLLIFNRLVMPFIQEEFAQTYSTNFEAINTLISHAMDTYKKYTKLFLSDFKSEWLILIGILCLGFLYAVISGTKQHRVITALLVLPALIGLFALSFGVYPVLGQPSFFPRCMYGIGAFLAFLGVFILSVKPNNLPVKLTCLALSWMFFSFAFTYGNALDAQSEWTDFRIEQVAEDLAEWDGISTEGMKSVRVTGTIGFTPVMRRMPQDYQILNRLVPVHFSDSQGWWGPFKLLHYYGFTNLEHNGTDDFSQLDLPVIVDNAYHTIRADEEHIWIDLHDPFSNA